MMTSKIESTLLTIRMVRNDRKYDLAIGDRKMFFIAELQE